MNLFKYLCHQRPDRSFFIGTHQFPVCSRCTGFLVGTGVFLVFSYFVRINYSYDLFYLSVILQIPYCLDGLTQYLGYRESNNILRFITGFIGAFGLIIMAILCGLFTKQFLYF